MKRSFALVVIVIIAALLAAPAWNFQDKKPIAAYIMKVVNNVEKRSGSSQGWSKAVLLSELKAGYEVRTQEKSLAMIKFADDSKVAVREKSIITISGEVAGGKILNRDVYIERGRTSFDIKKQQTEQFRFTSPISVASIRGTIGASGFDPVETLADITIISGVADFSSTRSGCSVTVKSGMTGRIDSTAQCRTDTASHNELRRSGLDEGTGETGGTGGTGGTGQSHGPIGQFGLSSSLSGTLASGRGVQIEFALVNPPVDIDQATLFYRVQPQAWKSVVMTMSLPKISGTVPGTDVQLGSTKTFEYYFSLHGVNGTTYTFPEANPETSPYTLPIKPRTIYIKIPVISPTGETRYFQISYER